MSQKMSFTASLLLPTVRAGLRAEETSCWIHFETGMLFILNKMFFHCPLTPCSQGRTNATAGFTVSTAKQFNLLLKLETRKHQGGHSQFYTRTQLTQRSQRSSHTYSETHAVVDISSAQDNPKCPEPGPTKGPQDGQCHSRICRKHLSGHKNSSILLI